MLVQEIIWYLQKIRAACDKLIEKPIITHLKEYRDLCHTTLVRIIVFNAKRGGEAGRMTIADYEQTNHTETTDFNLTPVEMKLCER